MGEPEGDGGAGASDDAAHRCEVCDALNEHVRRFFPQNQVEVLTSPGGPLAETNPHFHVLRIAPASPNDLWTYLSIGGWAAGDDERHGLEFILTVATEEPRAVDLLAMTVYYQSENPLAWGELVPIGEPWLAGSQCAEFLLSTPYPFSPELQTTDVGTRRVDFLWLLPVTEDESAYMRANGQEALESRFDEIGLEYWDVQRTSAI
jgi:Suppressor of fused protein (SUFU)